MRELIGRRGGLILVGSNKEIGESDLLEFADAAIADGVLVKERWGLIGVRVANADGGVCVNLESILAVAGYHDGTYVRLVAKQETAPLAEELFAHLSEMVDMFNLPPDGSKDNTVEKHFRKPLIAARALIHKIEATKDRT